MFVCVLGRFPVMSNDVFVSVTLLFLLAQGVFSFLLVYLQVLFISLVPACVHIYIYNIYPKKLSAFVLFVVCNFSCVRMLASVNKTNVEKLMFTLNSCNLPKFNSIGVLYHPVT